MKKYIPALVLALLLCCRPLAAREQNVNIYDTVREAPQESFYASDGRKLTLADFKGKFILLVSWSRDCLPCIRELPSLKGFYDATQSSGIELILLSDEGEWSDLEEQRRFLKKYKAEGLPFYVDPQGKLAESLGIFTSPHTVLINAKGHEIGRIRGSADWDAPAVIEYIYKLKSENNDR
jgi:redoxin domain protein